MSGFFLILLFFRGLSLNAIVDEQSIIHKDLSQEKVHFLVENFRMLEDQLFEEQTKMLVQIFKDWHLSGENPSHVAAFLNAFVDHLCVFLEAKKTIWESYWTLHTEDLLASLSVITYFLPKVRNFSFTHSDEYLRFNETNDYVKKIKSSAFDALHNIFYQIPLIRRKSEDEYKLMSLVLLQKMSEPMLMEQFRESLRDFHHVRLAQENVRMTRFESILTKLHLLKLPLTPRSVKMHRIELLVDLPDEDRIYLEFPLMKFINKTIREVLTIRSSSSKNARTNNSP